jgi:bifunctional N-acetylglucosamine-1-phosphate-uridyltransferase/glucosamine-1-phosphate-acetyltransferase GlmU-like protein
VPLAGRGLVLRLQDAVAEAGVGRTVVVVGHGAAQVRAALPPGVATAHQAVRDGTGGAVDCAREVVGDTALVFVFVGDSPLLRAESIQRLARAHSAAGAACSFLTATFPVSYPYARVIRDESGAVVACVEERDCTVEQRAIRELLTSHYCFDGPALWSALDAVGHSEKTGERYLTDVVAVLVSRGQRVHAEAIEDWRELVGINTPEELAWAEGVLAARTRQ